ncbi:MAG TPA: MFS transporter [Gemmatimonadaceae bacterium]|nr:MFS transporter [Gemmatimonadaceae bacterium]
MPPSRAAPSTLGAETSADTGGLALDSAAGRWVVAATVLGSGAVFVEGSVVNVALPAIARDLRLGMAGLQWVLNGYLLTLSALMLLGGTLGDRNRRSTVFAVGLVAFAVASAGCALSPTLPVLLGWRVVQGAAGALVVPNSLAMLETAFRGQARGVAIGHWAAWSAVSSALGPLAGGWLVEAASWRWVFVGVAPLALAAAWSAWRHVHAVEPPLSSSESRSRAPVDAAGAVLVTLGLAGITGALIVGPDAGFRSPGVLAALVAGVACLVAFVAVERRAAQPLLPLEVFRSEQFVGANVTTLLVYAALGGLFFLLMLQLQTVLGYGALAAGASLLPMNVLMLVLSPRVGAWSQRIGPRVPMAVGSLVAAMGMLLFTRVRPGVGYVDGVLPAVAMFGLGLSILVAPLTAAVLGAVDDRLAGVASGVNNAVARLAGLLATAALPLAVGLGGMHGLQPAALSEGFTRAMWIGAALCAVGGVVAWTTVSSGAEVAPTAHPSAEHGCVRGQGREC